MAATQVSADLEAKVVTFGDAEKLTDAELATEIYASDIDSGFERPLTFERHRQLVFGEWPSPAPWALPEGADTCSHVGLYDNIGSVTPHQPDAFERYYGP